MVCDKLGEIISINEQRKEQEGLSESADVANEMMGQQFMDFATDEFLNKNIRVRPASGITSGGERDDQKSDFFKANILSS